MPKKRTHRVTLSVTFNNPCTVAFAVAAVRDSIHGSFYPDKQKDGDPTVFEVRAAVRDQKPRRRQ